MKRIDIIDESDINKAFSTFKKEMENKLTILQNMITKLQNSVNELRNK